MVYILADKNSKIVHQHALAVIELQDLLCRDWEVNIKHVYIEANHATNYSASCGHAVPRGSHSVYVDNCNLTYYIRYDCMGISEPRMIT
ncbi:hypothetical protein LINPERHAP1_LOCUS15196 [Linum perenne]